MLAKRKGQNKKTDEEMENDDLDENNITVCGLIIDIEKITKQEILKMRKHLPKKDYRYVPTIFNSLVVILRKFDKNTIFKNLIFI